MALKNEYDFEYLKNQAEKLVLDEMEKQLALEENNNICKCQDCILDMAAYTLNGIKPMYKVSLMGELYAKAVDGTEYLKDLKNAVSTAIKKISTNPAH